MNKCVMWQGNGTIGLFIFKLYHKGVSSHLHEFVAMLWFYLSLSVCLWVYVSVCLCVYVSVNSIPIERFHLFWCGFHKNIAYNTGSNTLEIGDLGSVQRNRFYRHSLQTVDSYKLYLFVCVSVCTAFMAYISISIGRISVRLIVLIYHYVAQALLYAQSA